MCKESCDKKEVKQSNLICFTATDRDNKKHTYLITHGNKYELYEQQTDHEGTNYWLHHGSANSLHEWALRGLLDAMVEQNLRKE